MYLIVIASAMSVYNAYLCILDVSATRSIPNAVFNDVAWSKGSRSLPSRS